MEQNQPVQSGGIPRRGARLLWGYVRANPAPFLVSITGAAIYAGAAVAMTMALGRITNDVIVPSFETGRVSASTVLAAGATLMIIGFIRASTIALRRYFAAMLTYRTQAGVAPPPQRHLPRGAAAATTGARPPVSCSPTPTPTSWRPPRSSTPSRSPSACSRWSWSPSSAWRPSTGC